MLDSYLDTPRRRDAFEAKAEHFCIASPNGYDNNADNQREGSIACGSTGCSWLYVRSGVWEKMSGSGMIPDYPIDVAALTAHSSSSSSNHVGAPCSGVASGPPPVYINASLPSADPALPSRWVGSDLSWRPPGTD